MDKYKEEFTSSFPLPSDKIDSIVGIITKLIKALTAVGLTTMAEDLKMITFNLSAFSEEYKTSGANKKNISALRFCVGCLDSLCLNLEWARLTEMSELIAALSTNINIILRNVEEELKEKEQL